MQLTCPNCGQPVPAEQINIQRMAAVCPACHNIFQFDASPTKIKRQKIKQPHQITLDETDNHLKMAFRTNFRLDKNEAFLLSGGLSVFFTFITIISATKALANPTAALVTLGMGLFTLCLYYWLALTAFNKTHIEINDEEIQVSRRPLPNLLTQPNTISLAGVESIRYEETPASKKEAYDIPRYHVWAETVDGNRKLIVGDLIEEYAVFVSQRLNECLDGVPDVSHLMDEVEDGQVSDEFNTRSKSALNGH